MVKDNVKEYRGLVSRADYCNVLNGSAPWENEPDLVVGLYRGYAFAIVRVYSGSLNGYVSVPPGHRYFGVDCADIEGIRVHCGLTYASPDLSNLQTSCDIRMPKQLQSWWLGFDTNHWGDFAPNNKHRFGGGGGTYRDYGYVYEEILNAIRVISRDAEDTVDIPGPGVMPEVKFVDGAAPELSKMN